MNEMCDYVDTDCPRAALRVRPRQGDNARRTGMARVGNPREDWDRFVRYVRTYPDGEWPSMQWRFPNARYLREMVRRKRPRK